MFEVRGLHLDLLAKDKSKCKGKMTHELFMRVES